MPLAEYQPILEFKLGSVSSPPPNRRGRGLRGWPSTLGTTARQETGTNGSAHSQGNQLTDKWM